MSKHIETLVEDLASEFLKGTDIELVDVEYVKEKDWYLRVFIDKIGGIEIEDCQCLSEQLEKKLDDLDPILDSYYLEVSSPGLDRVLKKEKDFKRHMGEMVEITTYMPINGSKFFVGKLLNFSDKELVIDNNIILRDKISQIRLHIKF